MALPYHELPLLARVEAAARQIVPVFDGILTQAVFGADWLKEAGFAFVESVAG